MSAHQILPVVLSSHSLPANRNLSAFTIRSQLSVTGLYLYRPPTVVLENHSSPRESRMKRDGTCASIFPLLQGTRENTPVVMSSRQIPSEVEIHNRFCRSVKSASTLSDSSEFRLSGSCLNVVKCFPSKRWSPLLPASHQKPPASCTISRTQSGQSVGFGEVHKLPGRHLPGHRILGLRQN